MAERPVAQAVIVLTLIVLAAIAVRDVRLDYQPPSAESGLTVGLTLGGMASPSDITAQWIIPIESAARSVGDVAAMHSRIENDLAITEVRFRGGVDAEVKAARLGADLAPLRAKLPVGAQLSVWPSGRTGQQPKEVLAIGDAARASRVLEELRAAPGVRDVRLFGAPAPETIVRLRSDSVSPEDVRTAIRTSLSPQSLGVAESGARRVGVRSLPPARVVEDAAIPSGASLVHLGALADVERMLTKPEAVAHVGGRSAVLLLVFHDERVPLFSFARAVRQTLRGYDVHTVWSDAERLEELLRRAAIGAIAMSVALAILGFAFGGAPGLRAGLYPLLAIAIAINIVRIAGMSVDATSLIAASIAIAAFAPLALARTDERWPFVVALAFAFVLPIATALAPDPIPARFGAQAKLFAIVALAAACAAWLAPQARERRTRIAARIAAFSMRRSGSVALFTAAAAMLLFSYFGPQLDPRNDSSSSGARLYLRLSLAPGTTLAQTLAILDRIEPALATLRTIKRHWSFVSAGDATTTVEIDPRADIRYVRAQLRGMIPVPASLLSIDEAHDSRFDPGNALEEKPFADSASSIYRFILRGNDAAVLRQTADALVTRLARLDIVRARIQLEWPAPASRFELIPRPDAAIGELPRIAGALAARTTPQQSWLLPDGTSARIVPFGGPSADDEILQRADVFAQQVGGSTLAQRFELRTAFVPGGVIRDSGRFVLPVAVRVTGGDEARAKKSRDLDRTVANFATPPGVSIERPLLDERAFSATAMRVPLLIAFLPLLLAGLASVILSSTRAGLLVVASVSAGIAAAGPLLLAIASGANTLTLFSLAAALCVSAGCATILLARAGRSNRATWRALCRFQLPFVCGALAGMLASLLMAGASAAAQDGWRAPLLASAIVLAIATSSGALAAPACMTLARYAAHRRVARTLASTEATVWSEAGAPSIVVRNVTKRYGPVHALKRVAFELSPGITGLLGPNGAGKTTLLRIMTGLLAPTRGQVAFCGIPLTEHNRGDYRHYIGYLPQEFNAYPGLSALDFLDYWAFERGMTDAAARHAEVERLIALVGLEADAHRRVRDYSGGMRQRVGIARALLGDPRVVIVDEPTTGLDLEARLHFREIITRLAADRIIILSTHIVSDVEAVASRLLVLSRGAIVWNGDAAGLIARAAGRVFDMIVTESEMREITRTYRLTHRVRTESGIRVRGIAAANAPLPGPAAEPTLEEAYIVAAGRDSTRLQRTFSFLYDQEVDTRSNARGAFWHER